MLFVIVLLSLVAIGLVAGVAGWHRNRQLRRQLEAGLIDKMPEIRNIDQECCGQHEVCERDSLLAAVSKAIEYYDDEELDRYHGRSSDEYTDDECDEFRDILYTMKNEDVAGWVRSLQLRAITLPDAVKDEVFMIIGERRSGVAHSIIIAFMALSLLCGCSVKKNTALTRFYHSFSAHYNTTFNGEQAYLEGLLAQESGHRDDYALLLPMNISANQTTAGMGKSNYDRAIEKAEKAIKKHSIKAKPAKKGGKRLTAKEKAYRNRREFNPFLKRPWMMMAKAQFQKGEFIEAASTFNYIIRLYADQPDVASVARAWLARCYNELDWAYDAEDVLRKMTRDSITLQGQRERQYSLAGYYILTKQYDKAVENLQSAVKHCKRAKQRARLNYLLGQVAQLAGDNKTAYKAWQRVIRSNPPYELDFNARLRQAEVMSATQSSKILKRLRRMAHNDKNKDFLDQVYHAMGKVYLTKGDTMRCIGAFKTGVEKATQNGSAKAALLLHLAQIYWEREMYIEAAEAYAQCVSAIDKKHEDYAEMKRRNDILKELAPPLSDVRLQDSLLALSVADEATRNAAIDRVIAELKKKEKEERKKAQNEQAAAENKAANAASQNGGSQTPIARPGQKAAWYFYNPQTVAQGKQQFVRVWGRRKLEDNWRISDRQQVMDDGYQPIDYDADSLVNDTLADIEMSEEEARIADSLANDPHRREFYMKQIPFSDEAKQAAHQTIQNGLFNAGMIEITPLENYPLAERTLRRLRDDYPEFENMPEVFYHTFLLYGRQGRSVEAKAYRDSLIERWPEHELARLLRNPRYDRNARYGKQIEDSLYATAYDHYRIAEYDEVEPLYALHTEDFPTGPHRGHFLFVRAMSALYSGNRDTFFVAMKQLTEKYASDSITVWAKEILKGVQEGRLLNSDGMGMDGLWSRRSLDESGDSASIAADTLSADLFTGFVFVLAYPAHTLDENQLLYEVARYNFSTFVARNFEIEMVTQGDIHQLLVRGFNSFDEVHGYVQDLYSDARLCERLEGIRMLMISEENLKRLGRRYSYDDYDEFFQNNFVPMDVPEDLRLDEPDVEIIDPENIDPAELDAGSDNNDSDSPTSNDDFEWPW